MRFRFVAFIIAFVLFICTYRVYLIIQENHQLRLDKTKLQERFYHSDKPSMKYDPNLDSVAKDNIYTGTKDKGFIKSPYQKKDQSITRGSIAPNVEQLQRQVDSLSKGIAFLQIELEDARENNKSLKETIAEINQSNSELAETQIIMSHDVDAIKRRYRMDRSTWEKSLNESNQLQSQRFIIGIFLGVLGGFLLLYVLLPLIIRKVHSIDESEAEVLTQEQGKEIEAEGSAKELHNIEEPEHKPLDLEQEEVIEEENSTSAKMYGTWLNKNIRPGLKLAQLNGNGVVAQEKEGLLFKDIVFITTKPITHHKKKNTVVICSIHGGKYIGGGSLENWINANDLPIESLGDFEFIRLNKQTILSKNVKPIQGDNGEYLLYDKSRKINYLFVKVGGDFVKIEVGDTYKDEVEKFLKSIS